MGNICNSITVISVFGDSISTEMVLATAAVLGGSVCGDHISPISDTTILSSTRAGCKHINHVESQMQYGIFVAMVTAVCYFIAGVTENKALGLMIGSAFLILFVMGTKIIRTRKSKLIEE